MITEKAIQIANDIGASDVEVITVEKTNTQITFISPEKKIKITHSTGIGIQVAVGNRLGFYSTSLLNEKRLQSYVEKAYNIARVAEPDPNWKSFNKKTGKTKVSEIYDPDVTKIQPHILVDQIESATSYISEIDEKVKLTSGILDATSTVKRYANSYCNALEEKGTWITGYVNTKAEEAGKISTGSDFHQSRTLYDFNLNQIAGNAAKRALTFLDAKPIQTTKMPVIFRNKVFANILGIMLGSSINADIVQKGASSLKDKLGTSVAAQQITVWDDGRFPRGVNSSCVDDEGHPTQRTNIIEEGILNNYIYDNYTANKDNVESTGNSARNGYKTASKPSTSNLILEKGMINPDKLIEETSSGLYVETTIGEWLSNPVSGELNATVTHGHVIKKGELAEPVKGIVIAGNFYEIIRNGVELLANDTMNSSNNYSPTIKFSEISIAGS
jgi:PmbA protein